MSNNTINIGEELVQSSLKHKGKGVNSRPGRGGGRGVGADLQRRRVCSRSERVGQIYPGGDWLKGGGNTGTKVKRQDKAPGLSPGGASKCEEEVRKNKRQLIWGQHMPVLECRLGGRACRRHGKLGARGTVPGAEGLWQPQAAQLLESDWRAGGRFPGAGRAGAGGSCVRKQ